MGISVKSWNRLKGKDIFMTIFSKTFPKIA